MGMRKWHIFCLFAYVGLSSAESMKVPDWDFEMGEVELTIKTSKNESRLIWLSLPNTSTTLSDDATFPVVRFATSRLFLPYVPTTRSRHRDRDPAFSTCRS